MKSVSLVLMIGFVSAILVTACSLGKRSFSFAQTGARPTQADPEEVAAAKMAPERPILPATRFAAARLFESTHRFDKAIEQYRKVISEDANNVEAHHRLGILLGYLGRHREAEGLLRRAVQLSPSTSDLRNNLAFELMQQHRWSDAERELRRALMLNPDSERARTNLGVVLAAQGQFEDAFAEYRLVLPEPDAYYNLGLAYRLHDRLGEARKAFANVLAINPNFKAAQRQLDQLGPQESGGSQSDAENVVSPMESIPGHSQADKAAGDVTTIGAGNPTTLTTDQAKLVKAEVHSLPVITTWEGDWDNDDDVDANDLERFGDCFSGPGVAFQPGCAPSDFDEDGDVDLLDYQHLQTIHP